MQNIKTSLRNWLKGNTGNTTGMAIALLIFIAIACQCPKEDNKNRNGNNSNNNNSTSNDNKKKPNPKANQDKGDFIVRLPGVKNMKYQELDASIKQQKILDNAAAKLNKVLILPKDITLKSFDCGVENAFFMPKDNSINMCYELMDLFFQVFKSQNLSDEDANKRMFNAIQFVFLHELGHALVHNYELGVTGKEEDAADQLATYVSIEEMEDGEENALNGALTFMLLSGDQTDARKLPFADEHSLGPQRFYNILCWLYGHDPQKYANLVPKSLPEERAVRCSDEYVKFTRYWKKELKPFRKNLDEGENENE